MEATTTRTPQEVFGHHAEVLIAGDLEGIVADYSDDAVFITPGPRCIPVTSYRSIPSVM